MVPVVTGDFHMWVSVDDIVEEEANTDIYNYDSVENIAFSIKKDGLVDAPTVWKNSTTLASGHTRFRAFKLNGYTHLPVRVLESERPSSEYERIKQLHIYNMYRTITFVDRYRGVKKAREAYFNENGKLIPEEDFVDLLRSWGIVQQDWNRMEEMRLRYPKFYDFVMTGEMGVRDAHKAATTKPSKMRTKRELDNLLSKRDISNMTTSITDTVMALKTLDTGIIGPGKTFSPLAKVDQNFYSNAIHATVCAFMAHILNDFPDYADDWQVTDDQNVDHDVWSREDNTGIEIKTHQCAIGVTPRWTPKRFKEGYHLLVATSVPNIKGHIESIFIGFGKLNSEHVRPINQGKVEILPEKLYALQETGEFEVWKGKLSKDKDGKINFKQDIIN